MLLRLLATSGSIGTQLILANERVLVEKLLRLRRSGLARHRASAKLVELVATKKSSGSIASLVLLDRLLQKWFGFCVFAGGPIEQP